MSRPEHLVLVRVHHLLLGFDVRDVREVLAEAALLPVPLTPPTVRGLINLRGEVVTVIDARRLLGAPPAPPGARTTQIVLQSRRELVSLSVDEVLEVAPVQARWFAPRPDGMDDAVRRLAAAVVQRDRDLVVAIDVPSLFAHLADPGDAPSEDTTCAPS